MTTAELVLGARGVGQTVEGKFLAYSGYSPDVETVEWDYFHFPESPTIMAIGVIDSSYIEIYTKNRDHISLLKNRFNDVRDHDPSAYFAQ